MQTRDVAAIILYDKDKKILMNHRAGNARHAPGCWSFFGGKLEAGETPEQGLRRELKEELEYEVRNPQFVSTTEYDHMETNSHFIVHLFAEKYDESQTLVLHEGQGMGWFTPEEALKLKITEHRRGQLGRTIAFLQTL